MKKTFFLICIFFPSFIFAQFRSSFDIAANVGLNYRNIDHKHSENNGSDLYINNKGDHPKFGTSFGFNYNLRINERIVVKTGLRLTNIRYNQTFSHRMSSGENTDGGFSVPYPDPGKEVSVTSYNQIFLEIPLMARYEFKKNFGKFQPYVEAGLSASYYLTSLNKNNYGAVDIIPETFSGIRPFQITGQFGAGLNYDLSERCQLFFQPTFRYNVTPLLNSALKGNHISIGFDMGVRFKLN